MAKELLNEAERFLLKHWAEANLLEESMKACGRSTRKRFRKSSMRSTEGHRELDASKAFPTSGGVMAKSASVESHGQSTSTEPFGFLGGEPTDSKS